MELRKLAVSSTYIEIILTSSSDTNDEFLVDVSYS